MTTAVASPPSFQPLSRLGWNGGNTNAAFSAMSTEEVSRMFMPQRKVVQRSNSSSSLASTSSSTSTSTVTTDVPSSTTNNGEAPAQVTKKKPRGGFWPVSKSESTSGVTNTRANGSVQPPASSTTSTLSGKGQTQGQAQANGVRQVNGVSPSEPTAILALLPLNGTFERKQINVPFYPDVLRVGRQTNAKTVPTPVNGFFDSKVLSRQHAEVWAERTGKVFIRDIKSSNGTFVNGSRLSPENRESEPHELRQHDTLELGIDIVSEDQKTIVHHKVSAKVEYVGLPGPSNNVLDLNFGDLDPSHGGSLLPSPMSSPMSHSRSVPGGPPRSRASTPASVAGSQMSSMAQQRQANFWGSPLNVESLVKTLSAEMRTARQQAQELDQAGTFLTAVLSPNESPASKVPAQSKDASQSKQSNGRTKSLNVNHAARFVDPPAPPPQQPLPEKPDSAKASPINNIPFTQLSKRNENPKALTKTGDSPTGSQNSQILSLVDALSIAKKEIDAQGARVKQLEDLLKQERSAREDAEERARKLEQHAAARLVTAVEEDVAETPTNQKNPPNLASETQSKDTVQSDQLLQQRLDSLLSEMQRMKLDLEGFQRRAETAEADANSARTSLAEMIEKVKEENSTNLSPKARKQDGVRQKDQSNTETEDTSESALSTMTPKDRALMANGHVRTPSKIPEHLERALATVLRQDPNGEAIAQSAPYVSMLGVVLIGVGLMAYLNSWQKAER